MVLQKASGTARTLSKQRLRSRDTEVSSVGHVVGNGPAGPVLTLHEKGKRMWKKMMCFPRGSSRR